MVLSKENYVNYSLEINLFILRLAKEHAIFAAAALPPKYLKEICVLKLTKKKLENLLMKAVTLSDGVIRPEVLSSGEIVTDLTLRAEEGTQRLLGFPINMGITKKELALKPGKLQKPDAKLIEEVSRLNQKSIALLKTSTAFVEKQLNSILNCRAFSHLYPLTLNHAINESRFFTTLLMKLQAREDIENINKLLIEELRLNWNDIMKEHAMFIRGYLDPSEVKLFERADAFAREFGKLQQISSPNLPLTSVKESLNATADLKDFKRFATQGSVACKIRSVKSPLFYDHVVREANHYLRLLKGLVESRESIGAFTK